LRFVESVYSMGEWISPHRLDSVDALLWHAETDDAKNLYRCRNHYSPPSTADAEPGDDFYAYD
jgi:CRISPR-associated protein Csy2